MFGPSLCLFPFISRLGALLTVVPVAFALFAAPGVASANIDDYRLSEGDVLTFDFLDDDELPVTLTVTSDGDVQFPLIGDVRVEGLTLGDAVERLRSEFQTRDILKHPKISLNVASFRPIYVLGEVKNPGSFAYVPGLTVRQAIGLAGGTQTATTNPGDRVVARARLRGEMDGAQSEIVHEAIYAARLLAQLEGREVIDMKDVPDAAKPYLEDISARAVMEIEQRILDTDRENTKAQIDILTEGIYEAEQGLKILDDLKIQQEEIVEMNLRDLERVNTLRKRELNTESDLSRAKANTSNEKSRLLEIVAEMSRSRRELGSLKLELSKLKADRTRDILEKLQERELAINKLLAARKSAEEQFYLLAAVAAEEAKKGTISFTYEVRRNRDGSQRSEMADLVAPLLPGDVVYVGIAGI
ncbi:polysaccharide biosynthesis/export family protein [Rhizobium alarense]|uniref:polysaccharide biosynthesis/export family protein n=1 Tax=Rhizobium alarense TaxID=2846851 RepID=UPI0038B5D0E2